MGIKEIVKGISKGDQEKIIWNFQESWWFGLFQGWSFVLSRTSRGKVKKIKKFQGVFKCPQPLAFFSGIAQAMINNKFNCNQTE